MVLLLLFTQQRLGPGPRLREQQLQGEGNLPGLATERSESGRPLGLHKRSAAQCGRLGRPLAGASGRSPLGRVFAVAVRQGQALRTGDRSARGVAQDAPFLTAARLERRAGALTETEIR